jgi:hypothetical protein
MELLKSAYIIIYSEKKYLLEFVSNFIAAINVAATWAKPTPSQLGGADLSQVESSQTADSRST